MRLFCNSKHHKDKFTAASEYHSRRNNPYTKRVELLTVNWKQMAMQLGELDVYDKLCYGDVRAHKYIIKKEHVLCNLEIDTDFYSHKKRMHQQNAKQFFQSVMHESRYPN